MGCCFGKEEDKYGQGANVDETTGLLRDPVRNVSSRQGVLSDGYNAQTSYDSQKTDEQSALSRILHQTASNVIDVSAIDTQSLEHHDYHDRARQYSNRLTMALSNAGRVQPYKQGLPNGMAAPQIVLASQPVSFSDVQLITNAAEKAYQAVKEVKVQHKEDLVVLFGVQ